MGRFTDRCIESLLGELQMYAERANQAMSLIIDNFQLSYNEQEDTVDLTRIKHPDWYGNDFEGVCRVTLESYEGIIDDDTDKQYEYYLDLVESYFSEFEHCCPEKFYHSVSCLGPLPSGTLAVRSV